MKLNNNNMNVDHLHELARMFMYQFPELKPLSLDDFLAEYSDVLTKEQYDLGIYIVELFDKI